MFSTFSYAITEDNLPPQEDQAVIYVANGAVFFGAENISSKRISHEKEYSRDSLNNQVKSEDYIYVAAGASIYGENEISNVSIVKVSSVKEKNIKEAIAKLITPQQVLAEKNAEEKMSQQIQEKVIEKVNHTFFTSTENHRLLTFKKFDEHNAVVSSSSSYSLFANVVLVASISSNNFTAHFAKQEFITSFSFLRFEKYGSSSLRAPPSFIV